MSAIEVKSLQKNYGPLKAVDGISFSVEHGEVFSLLGPNGAGKTTTIEILEGLRERIRDVREGPDGALYLLTDSRNGRILRVAPAR